MRRGQKRKRSREQAQHGEGAERQEKTLQRGPKRVRGHGSRTHRGERTCGQRRDAGGGRNAAAVVAQLKAAGMRAVFVVVGDGHLRPQIQRDCEAMGLSDYVYLTGWKNEAGITMMPLFHIFFQPSLWEAMSMVVLEAMAAGKPVVATDVGDNRHVVRHDQTGYVVPVSDVDAMAKALQRLVHSEERRRAFGDAGRRRYEQEYTVQSMVRRYEQIYSQSLR